MPTSLTTDVLEDPVALTRALVDIESVSGDEKQITDAVEGALRSADHLSVDRVGNVVRARVATGGGSRVVLAGHLDTVPLHDNFPSTLSPDGQTLYGCGTADMKSGSALALHLAVTVPSPAYDVTYLFYDCEEVEAERNGLQRISVSNPDWLAADFAILLEPTYGLVEAGCQGTMRVLVRTTGKRAHSARSWFGENAIHRAGDVLRRLEAYQARRVNIDDCDYREGLNAVGISGGVAGNVIPDECVVTVNYRFAPDRSEAEAAAHVREVFSGYEVEITDSAPGARPGLDHPAAATLLAAVAGVPRAKFGWTDVARFALLGMPALNYGPGDPMLAHSRDEHVPLAQIAECEATLEAWLTG